MPRTDRKNVTTAAQTATGNNGWCTPPHIFQWLDDFFHFTLDAAASDANHLCDHYFTEEHNALTQEWVFADGRPHTAFINPPYGRGPDGKSLQGPFFTKALEQRNRHGVVSVLLVPPRTGNTWWHREVLQARDLWLLAGRIAFVDGSGQPVRNNTQDSCLVVFGPKPDWEPVQLHFITPPTRREWELLGRVRDVLEVA